MNLIRYVCHRCGYILDEVTEDELANDKRKQKRHEYLLHRANVMCPVCYATGRAKEIKTREAELPWADEAYQKLLACELDEEKVEAFAREHGYGQVTIETLARAQRETGSIQALKCLAVEERVGQVGVF